MPRLIVTAVDTTGIQNYIFGSNVLKHNVGASYLISCATQDWVYEELVALGPTNIDQKGHFNSQTIEEDKHRLTSELVYAGGGNTVILFQSQDTALEFTRRLTRRVLTQAPGLQLVVCHTEFNWESEALSQVVQVVLEKVSQKKRNLTVSTPLLGLSVTADCQYTGLPAVGKNKDDKRISAEIQAKEIAFETAHSTLTQLLPLNGYEIPKDFDDFGRTRGESSYIGVIHTDGNGMGKRVAAIANRYPRPEDNRSYIQAIRDFSQSVKQAAQDALVATYNQLIQSIDPNNKIGGVVPIRDRKLPLRPIVMGGDDVTFVCDGRLALTLTEFYLRQVTAKPLSDDRSLSVRAGIAVVKSHFPFARAYTLAEDLTRSAKEYIKERAAPPFNEQDLSAMDWHFAVSGVTLNLQQIRQQEYTVPGGQLTMRPLRLVSSSNDWRSWETFTNIINDFRSDKWIERRNKIIALRDALRKGEEAVRAFLQVHALPDLPVIPGNPDSAKIGWVGKRCVCFDAIEALEFFVPL
ncbi:Cas10/Cmr2 second palm domain-containing protein [Chloroflexus sp.]|uniref:Cas10/Cmr2 second palm domain-containing protein n=1 Tax=Chloroflexus sp. TaxID=1904827 RepID=UPI002ADE1E4E|nr:hypothetical protein [Chloroflexus sp.]